MARNRKKSNDPVGYALVREESVGNTIRRILAEEASASIATLENIGHNQEETVHTVRKRLKKIRALLRLVRSEIGAQSFGRENIRSATSVTNPVCGTPP